MWSPFIMWLKFYLLRTAQMQFVLCSLQAWCSLRLTHDAASVCLVPFFVRKTALAGLPTASWSFGRLSSRWNTGKFP